MDFLRDIRESVKSTTEVIDGIANFSTNIVNDCGSMAAEVIQGIGDLPATAIQGTTEFAAHCMTQTSAVGADIGQNAELPREFIQGPIDCAAEVLRNGGGGTAGIIRRIATLPATVIRESAGLTASLITGTTSAATGTCRQLAGLPIQATKDARDEVARTFVYSAYRQAIDILKGVSAEEILNLATQTVVDPLVLFIVIPLAIALVFFFILKFLYVIISSGLSVPLNHGHIGASGLLALEGLAGIRL